MMPAEYIEVDWTAAACRGDDRPDDWIDGDHDRARQVCHDCPIATRCLAFALLVDETVGLWGGLDPMERDRYRQKLYAALGDDDPVVVFLRARVQHRRSVLCPRCCTHRMQSGADMCVVCAEHRDETARARKRSYWNARGGREGAPGSPTVRREQATCEQCGTTFDRDVPARGRPVRLCSEACRRASEREHRQQLHGRPVSELKARLERKAESA